MRFVGLADSSLMFGLCFFTFSLLNNILENSSIHIYEDMMFLMLMMFCVHNIIVVHPKNMHSFSL